MAPQLVCPYCRNLIKFERCGVQLTLLKAGIFDAIKAAGDVGVSSAEIISSQLYYDRSPVSETTIKAHVWQINEQLESTDFIIVSDRRYWYLRKRTGVRCA